MTNTATKPKRLTANVKAQIANELIALESELSDRQRLGTFLGKSFGGNRDIYETLGYNKSPKMSDYEAYYRRNEIAKAVIDAPVAASWETFPEIEESNDSDTKFEDQAAELIKKFQLQQIFANLDTLSSIGSYAVLLMGFKDGLSLEQPLISKSTELLYLMPYGQSVTSIKQRDDSAQSPRFGLPTLYEITMGSSAGGGASTPKQVHYSRVIHVAQGRLTNLVEGTPRLEVILNRLQDIEKLVGGDAEAYWRTAEPTIVANIDPAAAFSADTDGPKWEEKILDMIHRLKKFMILQGTKVEQLQPQISDPVNHFSMLIDMVAAGMRIPKRILLGSEMGELASTADKVHWFRQIKSRREQFCEPAIVRPFIDKLVEVGVIPKPKNSYNVKWDDLLTPSDKEKAEVGKLIADALASYTNSGASVLVPIEDFLSKLGFDAEEIDRIKQNAEAAAGDNLDNNDDPNLDKPTGSPNDPTQGDTNANAD